jgi:hypothetical protein
MSHLILGKYPENLNYSTLPYEIPLIHARDYSSHGSKTKLPLTSLAARSR